VVAFTLWGWELRRRYAAQPWRFAVKVLRGFALIVGLYLLLLISFGLIIRGML
jgi:hypothetical protein